MGPPLRQRVLIPAALVLASVVYLVAGHAHHPGQSMEEAAMGAGICIVVATVAAIGVLPRRPDPPRFVLLLSTQTPPGSSATPPNIPRARASPDWLQRFLR